MQLADVFSGLRVPLIVAPMFLVSGPALVTAACQAGAIGSFPTANARSVTALDGWLDEISAACKGHAIWSANVVTHQTNTRLKEDLALISAYKVPLVITALGGPAPVVKTVHRYGGLVFADVNSVAYARKAIAAGADGLVLVGAGAGGHTGSMAGLSFLAEVREFFDGPLVLGGGLTNGHALRAVEVAGADLGIMGTRFIAAAESLASAEYRDMVVQSSFHNLTLSDAVTGVPAYWLDMSLERAGLDLKDSQKDFKTNFAPTDADDPHKKRVKRWSEIWSAGHGVGGVKSVESARSIVERLGEEYRQAVNRSAFTENRHIAGIGNGVD